MCGGALPPRRAAAGALGAARPPAAMWRAGRARGAGPYSLRSERLPARAASTAPPPPAPNPPPLWGGAGRGGAGRGEAKLLQERGEVGRQPRRGAERGTGSDGMGELKSLG
jgi:hypothetical protein